MNKKIPIFLTLALIAGMSTGCAGTPVVYYSDCTCPNESHMTAPGESSSVTAAGSVKTGLAIITSVAESENAAHADYDVTMVAITVDDNGIIADCIIDSLGTKVTFDASGAITADLSAPILTKNELGDDYGMVAYGDAKHEWYQQAAALADYAVGKTMEELKSGAIDESGNAPAGSDLASTATIYLGGYISAIEQAVNTARHLGAQAGDELMLAATASIGSSTPADAENDGTAQLDLTATALTMNADTITSCVIDAVQAKVTFDAAGTITSDLTAPVQTKNQLGESYGMKAWGGAIAEWNEQAAAFAAYITGKTPAEISNIAVDENTAPTDADLSASVTIKIGGFLSLIGKATK